MIGLIGPAILLASLLFSYAAGITQPAITMFIGYVAGIFTTCVIFFHTYFRKD